MVKKLFLFLSTCLFLVCLYVLYVAFVADMFAYLMVKDPPRTAPAGDNIVAPSDGRVIYVRKVEDGTVDVYKKGVRIPMGDLTRDNGEVVQEGWLIGIMMSVNNVHIQRAPTDGKFIRETIYNGPYARMAALERTIIYHHMIPGLVTLKKLLKIPPYNLSGNVSYVQNSARATAQFEDARGKSIYVMRISSYAIGKVLTWVSDGQELTKGEKWGYVTYGSQADVFIEQSDGLEISVTEGDKVFAGETILATY